MLTQAFGATQAGGSKVTDSFIDAKRSGNPEIKWELEKETKVNAEVLLLKSSGIILIFLPAFYLIMRPMTHQGNSEKISILKI